MSIGSATGVEVTTGVDRGAVWHYGEPVREQRAMAAGAAVVDLGHFDVLSVTGSDRLGWLHGLTTQHLTDLPPGVATSTLVLSPQGHIEHVLHLVDDGETTWIRTEPGRGSAAVQWLDSMRFMMRVEVADLSSEVRLVWVGDGVPVDGESVAERRADVGPGREVFLARSAEVPEAARAGMWAYEAHRIAAGVPRVFLDTDHRSIPNELGLYATHLDKGCYRGQETVARVHTLGRPPRRLILLHLDGSAEALPALASSIQLNDKQIGFVGGSARHHELGPIALGLVKRSVPVDADLLVDGIAAAQEALVDPEVGLHVRPQLR